MNPVSPSHLTVVEVARWRGDEGNGYCVAHGRFVRRPIGAKGDVKRRRAMTAAIVPR